MARAKSLGFRRYLRERRQPGSLPPDSYPCILERVSADDGAHTTVTSINSEATEGGHPR